MKTKIKELCEKAVNLQKGESVEVYLGTEKALTVYIYKENMENRNWLKDKDYTVSIKYLCEGDWDYNYTHTSISEMEEDTLDLVDDLFRIRSKEEIEALAKMKKELGIK